MKMTEQSTEDERKSVETMKKRNHWKSKICKKQNKVGTEARKSERIKLSINLRDDDQEPTAFKTRHAAYIAKVLGHNDKVVEYDKLAVS